ncbi:hypothetical protein [Rhizobium bangladeshense]|uniref:hypothetical protein n=1 Tax=Rhizobium bangladeshense TaxID=1138189 RepID=UPI00287F9A03|nr:hypothetical protein [Rhizobium bangladeshense]
MTVEVAHHVDASEPDADGFNHYHYEYEIYKFTDGVMTLLARAYSDEPGQAALMGWNEGIKNRLLTKRDLRHPLFLEAVAYFRRAGKYKLDWLDKKKADPIYQSSIGMNDLRHSKPNSKRRHSDTASVSGFIPADSASDLSWVPDIVALEQPSETAGAFVQAYLTDPDRWWWSTISLHDSRETVLKRVLAIIAQARLPDHERALGQLGAGPLENMMGDELLDVLGHWTPFTAAMCHPLGMVRMEAEPPALQRRAWTR